MTPEEIAQRSVEAMLQRDAFSAWLGITASGIAPGRAITRMTVRAEMLNGFGVCHGGVTFSLADSALAFASNTSGVVSVSIDNSISYPTPVKLGDVLTAQAESEGGSERLGFFKVTVTRGDGAVVALFRGTTYRTKTPLEFDAPANPASNV